MKILAEKMEAPKQEVCEELVDQVIQVIEDKGLV